jgi:hypothetical protein
MATGLLRTELHTPVFRADSVPALASSSGYPLGKRGESDDDPSCKDAGKKLQ